MADKLLIFLLILYISIISLVLICIINRNYNKKMQERALKMSYSAMFLHLLPYINEAKKYAISNLLVNSEGVHFYFFNNAPIKTIEFIMNEQGYTNLSDQNINVLLLLLEQSIPIIKNNKYYEFKQSKKYLINGSTSNIFNYHAKIAYYNKVEDDSNIINNIG